MGFSESENYIQSPLFNEAMNLFRVGKWEDGFVKLIELEKKYPMETDLFAIRQEMEVRSRISTYEAEENSKRRVGQLKRIAIRTVLTILIVLVSGFALFSYWGFIQREFAKAQFNLAQSVLQAQLNTEFRNAQELLVAGKSEDALAKYRYIEAKDPNFPGLKDAISSAQNLKDIETQYTQSMSLLAAGDTDQALAILQDINKTMPNYRDVSLQIKKLQSESQMVLVIQQADKAFLESRYEDAISGYESLRLLDPTYQKNYVEEKLFQSYNNAAQVLLGTPLPTLDTLKQIDTYFSKALALKPLDRDTLAARTQVRLVIEDALIGEYLSKAQAAVQENPDSMEAQKAAEDYLAKALAVRPNDPNVLAQYQTAQAYIKAVNDFAASRWNDVIDELEFVIAQQAGYANGTALQTLYDAYIARGSDYIAAGEYSLALDDFQRSAVLAKQLEDAGPLSFEAQVMIAEAQGSLNHFQEAVLIYRDAINTIGLADRIYGLHNNLTDTLSYAEAKTTAGDYQAAFYSYRSLIQNRVSAYDQTMVITVKNGDYISMLAHRYNTTVAAILSANKMNNQPRLTPNTQLIIPTLP